MPRARLPSADFLPQVPDSPSLIHRLLPLNCFHLQNTKLHSSIPNTSNHLPVWKSRTCCNHKACALVPPSFLSLLYASPAHRLLPIPIPGCAPQAAMIPANVGFPTSITQSQFLLDRINNHVKTRMLMNSSIGILTANVNTRPHRRPTTPSNVRSSTPNPNSRITSFIKIAAA